MRVYTDKTELIEEINKVYKKYIEEFNEIPETLRDKRVEEVDKTPSENLHISSVGSACCWGGNGWSNRD